MTQTDLWIKPMPLPGNQNMDQFYYFCADLRRPDVVSPLFGSMRIVESKNYSFAQTLIVISSPPNKITFLDSGTKWLEQARQFAVHLSVTALEEKTKISETKIKELWETLAEVVRSNKGDELPVETFDSFPKVGRRLLWSWVRDFWAEEEPWFFDQIKTTRKTTLDYLNLQALGIDEYQKTIASKEANLKTSPLIIRDRVQYARKMGWIKKPSYGSRQSNQLRLSKDMN